MPADYDHISEWHVHILRVPSFGVIILVHLRLFYMNHNWLATVFEKLTRCTELNYSVPHKSWGWVLSILQSAPKDAKTDAQSVFSNPIEAKISIRCRRAFLRTMFSGNMVLRPVFLMCFLPITWSANWIGPLSTTSQSLQYSIRHRIMRRCRLR